MIDLPLGVNIGRCSFLLQIKVLSFCKENQRSLCFFLFFLKVHCKYSYQLMAYVVLNVKAYTVFLFIWDGLNSNHRMVLAKEIRKGFARECSEANCFTRFQRSICLTVWDTRFFHVTLRQPWKTLWQVGYFSIHAVVGEETQCAFVFFPVSVVCLSVIIRCFFCLCSCLCAHLFVIAHQATTECGLRKKTCSGATSLSDGIQFHWAVIPPSD